MGLSVEQLFLSVAVLDHLADVDQGVVEELAIAVGELRRAVRVRNELFRLGAASASRLFALADFCAVLLLAAWPRLALARLMASSDRFNAILDDIVESMNDRGNTMSKARFAG